MEQANESSRLPDRLNALIDEVEGLPLDGDMASAPTEKSSAVPDLSSLLGGLAANPGMMARLPQMLGMLGPLLGGLGGGPPSGGGGGGKPHTDRHTALLCAVKPYLCAERQVAAERLIQLCKMWDLLQKAPAPQGGDGHV